MMGKTFYSKACLFILSSVFTIIVGTGNAQVVLRDTVMVWQHHQFELNSDYSMKQYSTIDSEIEEVQFVNAKVLENNLIRLVILPEYGGRVISFVYKPTGHEYLYQSECGSPYGMNEGNFYYDWLMVYGGIFPTLPESEHGKTWLLPWEYSLLKNTSDTITIRLSYTDESEYSGAPWKFNNGITNMTCQVDISLYSYSAIWDFDVRLINNNSSNQIYEYWTCTTLAPGSEPDDTGTPLNTQIVIPVEKYIANWSPGSWIGNYNSKYEMTHIDYLYKWDNMGIAYADGLDQNYWGVINQDNQEGIFRISDNSETKGVKLWTWGKNNIDNNLYDFSNGGADNYVELWGGTSDAFFMDAILNPEEEISWKESYAATLGLSDICAINNIGAVNLLWDADQSVLSYQLNTFLSNEDYIVKLYLEGNSIQEIVDSPVEFSATGQSFELSLEDLQIPAGVYTAYFELWDQEENRVLTASKSINFQTPSDVNDLDRYENKMSIAKINEDQIRVSMDRNGTYDLELYTVSGQLINQTRFIGGSIELNLPAQGIYIVRVLDGSLIFTQKTFR